jgi:hypothetical protein
MSKALTAAFLTAAWLACAAPKEIVFSQSAASVAAYDFVEITLHVSGPPVGNPFTEAAVTGEFRESNSQAPIKVDGFSDSSDGTLFRIRFMPAKPGDYAYTVRYAEKGFDRSHEGTFRATASGRKGPIRVDPDHPWHFIWEGTRDHYFFNGTTAFWLMGWRDERVIESSLERLRRLKVNRVRVLLSGRTNTMYGEPAMNTSEWSVFLSPWPAAKADDFYHPGFDYTRFRVEHWQRFERMLRFAHERDMIVSTILDIADGQIHLSPGSEDERRYIRYATARLTAFSNITWDLGDDLDTFRDDKWAHETGTQLEAWDPYRHLATTHPVHREHQDRGSEWFGFTSIQDWSRDQHKLMLEERRLQLKTSRIIPQANEEYGYEDHYPMWAPAPPGDSADTLRRTAWDIAMAGAYGTAGETARRGVGIWPDSGGGWMNGRSDDTTTMLAGYAHMVDFMTSFEWWKTEPHDDLVDGGNWCLAEAGRTYAVYLPRAGKVTVRLAPGRYNAEWFNPMTGETIPIGVAESGSWTSPAAPGRSDWALLIRKSA